MVESLAASVIPRTAPRLPTKQEVKHEGVSSSTLMTYKPTLPVANSSSPGNGEVHSQYHSYFVKAEVSIPPEEPEEEVEEEKPESATALARAPPPVKQYTRTPTPSMPPAKLTTTRDIKPEPKLKKQDSLKPKSLSETKKASMEITTDVVEEESVSDL